MTGSSEQDRQAAKLRERYEAGDTLAEAARSVRLSQTAARQKLIDMGVKIRPRGPAPTTDIPGIPRLSNGVAEQLTAEERRQVAELLARHYRSGTTMHQLTRAVGRPSAFVKELLAEAGETIRPRGSSSALPAPDHQEVEVLLDKLLGAVLAEPDPLERYHQLTREQALHEVLVAEVQRRRGEALAELCRDRSEREVARMARFNDWRQVRRLIAYSTNAPLTEGSS